ncbi:solute carrier family 22 member 17-like [Sinocyclocheilus rhinocerous]|uniref:solute carrier family 22 member 17-like n=1 Tax=Sinocyclocheilus rhinocerous TaxID=307959 RepID=UPI0007BA60A5|nr:PREDICTED: solute carrier family 22 member 17-like [Sinocyclocheilus rhinocerous]
MTSPPSPLASPSPCPPPPPSLPSSPTLSSPAPSSLPLQPALPPTGEVTLLSSDPLLPLSPPFRCRLPGPSPAPQVTNASVRAEKRDGDLPQCKQFINGTRSSVKDCDAGYEYNVTEGLTNNIVTEVGRHFCVSLRLAVGVELCDPSLRLPATMMSGLTVFAGELLLLAVALGCGSWRGLLGTGVAPLSLFLCYGIPGVFPESPRWLLLSERTGDMNSFSERQRDDDSFTELDTESSSSPGRPHLSFPELLHSRNIWKNLCVLGFTSFISHGISHCYSSFRGDVRGFTPSFYWTYLLSVCAGGGAWLLLWATVDRFGRRGILLLAMTLTGLASLILLGLMDYLSESAMTVFSIMGLFSSQAAASLSILFTAEVMPTIIRKPCLALLAVLSILLLPESKRKPLPQTLADGEQYRRPPLGRRRRDNVPLLATPNPET